MLRITLIVLHLFLITSVAVSGQTSDKIIEYRPTVRLAPQYPFRAIEEKIEGFVVVSFTIDTEGNTKNIRAVDSSHKMFERNTIKAVERFKFRPRTINGIPVEVDNVTNKIEFGFEH
ncbi:MAG: energy transducer TonB [Proteobacteria bacterium]|jgi:periplasmic protein TonB|nr:energy transducer TonB [Pseudomonadota bacterium]